jgi:hypothetical protein
MKKQSIKNLSLRKKSISKLQNQRLSGGQESVILCLLTVPDRNGNDPCISRLSNCVEGCRSNLC